MPIPLHAPPPWVADAVFYQVFPDRFARSGRVPQPEGLEEWEAPPTIHGYKGGDLRGIIERLDHLVDLGCNAIYLNPIFQSGSNHRYHTHDYFTVDPLLGGNEAFDDLLRVCHERGIRVVLDGVFNHASRGFYQFSDILENGPHSPWTDWFHVQGFPLRAYEVSGEANYAAWWGIPALPKFNTDNPEVREMLMQVGEYWIDRGIDGWRLDVPEEVTTEGFWEEFRSRVRARNPDAYLVGEIWADAADWIGSGERFDGAMNYLLTGFLIRYAAGDRVDPAVIAGASYEVTPPQCAGHFADAVDWLWRNYPEDAQRSNLNLLGSHDTPRILSVASGDVPSVILATLLVMTFPGAPCVYYGDEVGLEGRKDPDNRRGFPWDPRHWDRDVLDATRSLIRLRHDHPALRHGDHSRVWPPPGTYGVGLYAFTRSLGDDRLLVATNNADDPQWASIDGFRSCTLELLWGSGDATWDEGALHVAMEPRSGAVWRVVCDGAGAQP